MLVHKLLTGLFHSATASEMNDHATVLQGSPFWNKKLDRAVQVRDVDKDGLITRKDFELVVQRYKDLGGVTAEQLQRIKSSVMGMCDAAGLVDNTKQLTREEFKKRHSSMSDHTKLIFQTMFRGLDINGDGVVSIDEWELHYKCMGIDPKHAKASFEAMDTNGDGVVSGEEFLAYHVEYFSTTENKLNSAILYGPL